MKEDMIIQLIKSLNNIKLYFGKLLPYIIYSMFIIMVIIIISIIIIICVSTYFIFIKEILIALCIITFHILHYLVGKTKWAEYIKLSPVSFRSMICRCIIAIFILFMHIFCSLFLDTSVFFSMLKFFSVKAGVMIGLKYIIVKEKDSLKTIVFSFFYIIVWSLIIRYTGFGNETIFETFIIKPTRSILDYKVHCLVPSMKPGLEPDDYEAANFMFVQFLFIDPKIYEESLISFIKKSTTTDRHISENISTYSGSEIGAVKVALDGHIFPPRIRAEMNWGGMVHRGPFGPGDNHALIKQGQRWERSMVIGRLQLIADGLPMGRDDRREVGRYIYNPTQSPYNRIMQYSLIHTESKILTVIYSDYEKTRAEAVDAQVKTRFRLTI